ncbi:MAG TPA: hypothetical protein VFJ93_15280 [Gaiellaceae bacterium]|nr:hypothetical protein [Gaiellaceae bacterium]
MKITLVTTVATGAWAFMFIVLSAALAVLLLIAVGIATLFLRRTLRRSH